MFYSLWCYMGAIILFDNFFEKDLVCILSMFTFDEGSISLFEEKKIWYLTCNKNHKHKW